MTLSSSWRLLGVSVISAIPTGIVADTVTVIIDTMIAGSGIALWIVTVGPSDAGVITYFKVLKDMSEG